MRAQETTALMCAKINKMVCQNQYPVSSFKYKDITLYSMFLTDFCNYHPKKPLDFLTNMLYHFFLLSHIVPILLHILTLTSNDFQVKDANF